MVHIKYSERRVVQLFKNIYAFYDKKLEESLPKDKTILDHISEVLHNDCGFSGPRQPKQIVAFLEAVSKLKKVDGVKKEEYKITQTDFVKFFISEHVIGSTQMAIKKILIEKKSNVAVDFNYMPESHLYCIFNKVLFEKQSQNISQQDLN